MATASRVQRRAGPLLAAALLALGGCDYRLYSYRASGRVLDQKGAPLGGVRVGMCAPEDIGQTTPRPASVRGPSTAPAGAHDEFLIRDSAVSDQGGFYKLTFTAGLDKHQWLVTHQAPELPVVYLWVRAGQQWNVLPVAVPAECQRETFPEGRAVRVPDAVFPQRDVNGSNRGVPATTQGAAVGGK